MLMNCELLNTKVGVRIGIRHSTYVVQARLKQVICGTQWDMRGRNETLRGKYY